MSHAPRQAGLWIWNHDKIRLHNKKFVASLHPDPNPLPKGFNVDVDTEIVTPLFLNMALFSSDKSRNR